MKLQNIIKEKYVSYNIKIEDMEIMEKIKDDDDDTNCIIYDDIIQQYKQKNNESFIFIGFKTLKQMQPFIEFIEKYGNRKILYKEIDNVNKQIFVEI